MRQYVALKNCPEEEERKERLMIRDFILILSNTALRVGELRQLRWGDVEGFRDETDEAGKTVRLVSINVRREISKVRNSRKVVSRGGEYFERHKQNSSFTGDENLVFTNKTGTHMLGTRVLYQHWYRLMDGIGVENYKERKLSYYSLRHFAITCRLRASVPILIAQFAGTGVQHIENHWSCR